VSAFLFLFEFKCGLRLYVLRLTAVRFLQAAHMAGAGVYHHTPAFHTHPLVMSPWSMTHVSPTVPHLVA